MSSTFHDAGARLSGSLYALLCSPRLRLTVAVLALIVLISLPVQWFVLQEVLALTYRGEGPELLQRIAERRHDFPLGYYACKLNAWFVLWAMIVVVGTAYLFALTRPMTALRQHLLAHRPFGLRERLARVEPVWVVLGAGSLSLAATLAAATLRGQFARVEEQPWLLRMHGVVIGGEAPAPCQYRILTPYLAEGLHRLGPSLLASYDVIRWIATFLAMVAFYLYARRWLSGPLAGLSLLVLTAILPFTALIESQNLEPIELLVFTLGLWAIRDGRDAMLVPLVVVGTLNKETAGLLVAFWAVNRISISVWPVLGGARVTLSGGWPRIAVTGTALVAAWTLPYVGLRLWFGLREYYVDFVMLGHNLVDLRSYLYPLLLFGPLWYLAVRRASRAPAFLRRSLLVIPPYFAICWLLALPSEARLFLILAPIILPLAMMELEEKLMRPSPSTGDGSLADRTRRGWQLNMRRTPRFERRIAGQPGRGVNSRGGLP